MSLRWGIASSGKIAHDFVTAIQNLPNTNHKVVAVAARSKNSAEKFAKELDIKSFYEGYASLADDQDVEIVYVGVLNPQHYEVTKLMLENGKHVLCEKPFTMNERQTRDLIELSKAKKLFLMEAVWSRCFPVYRELEKIIKDGTIGDIIYATVGFGFELQNVDRLKSKEMGGGAILDLGIYILQFQQYAFRGLTPTKIVAAGHLNEAGTDNSVSAVITYPNGKTAAVSASSVVKLQNEGLLIGTKGTILIPDFWCPTKLIINDEVKDFPLPTTTGIYNYHNSAGLAYEAEEALNCIKQGEIESSQVTHEETIQLSKMMDTLRKEVGVVFPSDTE